MVTEKYEFYDEPELDNESDDINREIDEYCRTIRSSTFKCQLEFFKANHAKFPLLANLAKKYLDFIIVKYTLRLLINIKSNDLNFKKQNFHIR